MSIVRIAMRIAICQALKGRTEVGDNVLDSQIGLAETGADGEVTTQAQRPFISVYADSASVTDMDHFRSFVSNGSTEIKFDVGIAAHHVTVDPDTDEAVILDGVPATDDGMEFFLDMVVRQIGDALNDPENPWADFARSYVKRVVNMERACAASGVRGVRVALHQLRLLVDLWPDPVRGRAITPESLMGRFFTLAETLDDRTRAKVAKMRAQLEVDASSIAQAYHRYGFTQAEADALLITMHPGVPDDQVITSTAPDDEEVIGA